MFCAVSYSNRSKHSLTRREGEGVKMVRCSCLFDTQNQTDPSVVCVAPRDARTHAYAGVEWRALLVAAGGGVIRIYPPSSFGICFKIYRSTVIGSQVHRAYS